MRFFKLCFRQFMIQGIYSILTFSIHAMIGDKNLLKQCCQKHMIIHENFTWIFISKRIYYICTYFFKCTLPLNIQKNIHNFYFPQFHVENMLTCSEVFFFIFPTIDPNFFRYEPQTTVEILLLNIILTYHWSICIYIYKYTYVYLCLYILYIYIYGDCLREFHESIENLIELWYCTVVEIVTRQSSQ